jgi:hypothetical protein
MRRGRSMIGRIAVLLAVALLVLAAYAYVEGTAIVIVENRIGADASVTVFTGPQPIGGSHIANGGSDWYIFTPHQDGDFAVGCRRDTDSAVRTAHAGHVPSGAHIFRVTLSVCGKIAGYSEE